MSLLQVRRRIAVGKHRPRRPARGRSQTTASGKPPSWLDDHRGRQSALASASSMSASTQTRRCRIQEFPLR